MVGGHEWRIGGQGLFWKVALDDLDILDQMLHEVRFLILGEADTKMIGLHGVVWHCHAGLKLENSCFKIRVAMGVARKEHAKACICSHASELNRINSGKPKRS